MEEMQTRKLHPVLEILIIAVISYATAMLIGLILNPFMVRLIQSARWSMTAISLLRGILGLFLGSVICFKVIEKQPVHWGAILLICAAYKVIVLVPSAMVTSYIARFGEEALLNYTKISVYLFAVLAALAVTVVVRMLCAPKVDTSAEDPSAKIGLVAHVLLLLFIGGIWRLIWIYRTTRYLNCMPDEEYRNPATKLLLCMFVPFYSIYWVYKSAQRIDKLAAQSGAVSDLAVACLILEIFIPLIPPILMQDKINKIVEAR